MSSPTRPHFIKNLGEVDEERHYLDQPAEKYRTRRRLGKATGAARIGVNYCRMRPGQVSSRFHYHTHEEEFLLVLEGQATLRVGEDCYEVGPGDAISLKAGGPAHQLLNRTEEDCIYLAVGMRDPADTVVYPDNKAV
ncbi:MAG: cupin domain-containing protein [Candidatus Neomarinimicrobiota bacterium]